MKKLKEWARVELILALLLCLPGLAGGQSADIARSAQLEPTSFEVPTKRSLQWREQSELTERVLRHWADSALDNWRRTGKIGAPRALMGRFLLREELDEANAYLMQQKPWGKVGSTWKRNPDGDYDFTLAGLTPILFLFGDQPEVLYPQTRDHLLNVLLSMEGGDPLITVPGTLGMFNDTENHILMTEGSRYLKNRWHALHGSKLESHDNVANGLEAWLLTTIEKLQSTGPYEFNSIPYEGYTLTALLNLEAFGSPAVQTATRQLLDQLNWNYALGSLSYRRFPPFRRQSAHAGDRNLSGDRHVALIKPWISLLPDAPGNLKLTGSHHVALWACWSPYRLPDKAARWILKKPSDYFVQLGHGPTSSPEIYSGGPGFLLTAGGVHRSALSQLVARPITLILDDDSTDLSQVLHLAGPGEDYRQWNNTGVWHNFAVTGGPVHLPQGWSPDAEGSQWQVYRRGTDLCVAVHSSTRLGIVHLTHSSDPQAVLEAVENVNSDKDALQHTFQSPKGVLINYDTHAPRNRWVIKRINGQPVDREFDGWPRLQGDGVARGQTITIGLIGDSTVASTYGWGPAFAHRFNDQTKVLNYAKNGASLESLSKKLDSLLNRQPDYVFIQFGHNDQKRYDTKVYGDQLRSYVERISEAGGTAIIVSSVTRRNFDEHGKIRMKSGNEPGKPFQANLAAYAQAAQTVARELKVPFIDLHTISIAHHNKIGPKASAVYNFSDSDTTHFSKKGANAIADLLLKELKPVVPKIAAYLKSLPTRRSAKTRKTALHHPIHEGGENLREVEETNHCISH